MSTQQQAKAHVNIFGAVVPHKAYFATMKPAAAREVLFISTYDDEDPKSPAVNNHGYQRPPTEGRFSEIAHYYQDDKNSDRIPPLLISVRLTEPKKIDDLLALLRSGAYGEALRKYGNDALSVIDGQHRLKGLLRGAEEDQAFAPDIPMVLYCGLSFSDEAELFNTINITQRKLPKALIETTRGDITEVGNLSYVQHIRRIAFKLCRDQDSVWGPTGGKEQINMTGIRDPNRPVTYEGLRRSTSNMFPSNLLDRIRRTDPELPASLAKRFWKAVSEACPAGWTGEPGSKTVYDEDEQQEAEIPIKYRLKDLVGVAALARLGQDIIRTHLDASVENKLEELVAKLTAVDWAKDPKNSWMQSQAGFAGQKELYEVLYTWVYSDIAPEGA